MSHSIPVLFGVVDIDIDLNEDAGFWDSGAEAVMSALHAEGQLGMSTSRNWWHLGIRSVADEMALDGLEFMRRDSSKVHGAKLASTVSTLTSIIASLQAGSAPLAGMGQWHARVLAENPPQSGDFDPQQDIDDGGDVDEPAAARSLYRFCGSLSATAETALQSERALFWAIVQP